MSTLPRIVFSGQIPNPYRIENIIASLIEMLELPNFGHIATYTIKFESRDKFLLVTPWTKTMTL